MICSVTRVVNVVVGLLLLSSAGPLAAETFYNQDGVQLSATARVIDPGAATCRIREERHTAEQYEKLKPNHGQPLDVWRVELVVANYSGKVLDYLTAHMNVESAWPPCDNWDGLGNYGKQVVWTGPLMSIQDVGSVAQGEERREIEFVLVFHDQEPALGRWDIDYDFAAATPAGTASSTARSGTESVRTGADQPSALASNPRGEQASTRFEPQETRADKQFLGSCWQEILEQPGCYIWRPAHRTGEGRGLAETWSGDCSGGRASGKGEESRFNWVHEGSYRDGKRNGHWVERLTSGEGHDEGPYVDGVKHGHWVEAWRGGFPHVQEGPYVDGKRHGHWVIRQGSDLGYVSDGPYVDDKRHGYWTTLVPGGEVLEQGPYVNGRRHGRWTVYNSPSCYSDGEHVDC